MSLFALIIFFTAYWIVLGHGRVMVPYGVMLGAYILISEPQLWGGLTAALLILLVLGKNPFFSREPVESSFEERGAPLIIFIVSLLVLFFSFPQLGHMSCLLGMAIVALGVSGLALYRHYTYQWDGLLISLSGMMVWAVQSHELFWMIVADILAVFVFLLGRVAKGQLAGEQRLS